MTRAIVRRESCRPATSHKCSLYNVRLVDHYSSQTPRKADVGEILRVGRVIGQGRQRASSAAACNPSAMRNTSH